MDAEKNRLAGGAARSEMACLASRSRYAIQHVKSSRVLRHLGAQFTQNAVTKLYT